jgi:hypothetical protein
LLPKIVAYMNIQDVNSLTALDSSNILEGGSNCVKKAPSITHVTAYLSVKRRNVVKVAVMLRQLALAFSVGNEDCRSRKNRRHGHIGLSPNPATVTSAFLRLSTNRTLVSVEGTSEDSRHLVLCIALATL